MLETKQRFPSQAFPMLHHQTVNNDKGGARGDRNDSNRWNDRHARSSPYVVNSRTAPRPFQAPTWFILVEKLSGRTINILIPPMRAGFRVETPPRVPRQEAVRLRPAHPRPLTHPREFFLAMACGFGPLRDKSYKAKEHIRHSQTDTKTHLTLQKRCTWDFLP